MEMEQKVYTCLLLMIVAVTAKPIDHSANEVENRVNQVVELYEDAAGVLETVTQFLGTLSQLDPKSTEIAREKASTILPEKRGAGPGFQTSAWRKKRNADDVMESLTLTRRLDEEANQMIANIYDFLDCLDDVRQAYRGTVKQTRSKGFKTSAW